jgi:hypothetical protein
MIGNTYTEQARYLQHQHTALISLPNDLNLDLETVTICICYYHGHGIYDANSLITTCVSAQ